MDDTITYSAAIHEHFIRATDISKRLREVNLKIQTGIWEFHGKEIDTQEGLKPYPAKIDCVQKFIEQKNPEDLKSFLGLTSY